MGHPLGVVIWFRSSTSYQRKQVDAMGHIMTHSRLDGRISQLLLVTSDDSLTLESGSHRIEERQALRHGH